MNDAGGNKHLFADPRSKYFTANLKLDVALERHHELIGRMGVILPRFPGRISPEIAAEASRAPVGSNQIDVYHGYEAPCQI